MASVIVSAWLVEAKQRVIENMAPVLTASSPAFRRHPGQTIVVDGGQILRNRSKR
jgi:hypothetical protein